MNINLNFILESSSNNSKNKILLSDYLLRFPRLVSKEGLLNLNKNMFYNLRESYTSIRCFDEDCMIESVIINLERGFISHFLNPLISKMSDIENSRGSTDIILRN